MLPFREVNSLVTNPSISATNGALEVSVGHPQRLEEQFVSLFLQQIVCYIKLDIKLVTNYYCSSQVIAAVKEVEGDVLL